MQQFLRVYILELTSDTRKVRFALHTHGLVSIVAVVGLVV